MHDFRSWVLQETAVAAGTSAPIVGTEIPTSPKEKIDIEMGGAAEFTMEERLPIPGRLPILDDTSLDNDDDDNDASTSVVTDETGALSIAVTPNPASETPSHSMQSKDGENGAPGKEADGAAKDERGIQKSFTY